LDIAYPGAPTINVMVPFASEEAISICSAAKIAGRSERALRAWCSQYGIGRRIGGVWAVSRVALVMLLDGDREALVAYHGGLRRSSEKVSGYYARCGLARLLSRVEFSR
jgi:hypothetical protein